jgi:hypothetical protein
VHAAVEEFAKPPVKGIIVVWLSRISKVALTTMDRIQGPPKSQYRISPDLQISVIAAENVASMARLVKSSSLITLDRASTPHVVWSSPILRRAIVELEYSVRSLVVLVTAKLVAF